MVSTHITSASPLPVFLGNCESCIRPLRVVTDETTGPDFITINCPECHAARMGTRVYGTITNMTCDPRCEGAIGNDCSCACGGCNHGGVWSKTGTILADALAKYRAEIAAREAKRQARADAENRKRLSTFDEWAKDYSELIEELTTTDWLEGKYPNEFLADLAQQLRQSKPLSDNQVNAAQRTLDKRHAAKLAAEARAVNAVEVPEGPTTITGIVIAKYEVPDNYNRYGGTKTNIRVEVTNDDGGRYSVSGTCPRSLLFRNGDWDRPIDIGDKVTFTAGLKPNGHEVGSGYFNRPRKAEFTNPSDES